MRGHSQLWTPMQLIKVSAEYLADQGVENARLNAELLLAHVLDVDRLQLYLDHDRPIVPEELERYRELVRRRGQRVPVQILLGTATLLDHDFEVREGVFLPRPETETLVLEARGLDLPGSPHILEVGTGSGCVGLSLLAEWPEARLVGCDINPAAVELTARNAERLGCSDRLQLHHGSAFAPEAREWLAEAPFDLLISNPPYVLSKDLAELEPEVLDHDPREALDGGDDGLDVVRELSRLGQRVLRPGGWLIFEHGYDQGESAPALLRDDGWTQVEVHRDLGGRPRVSRGRRSEA